MHQNPTHRLTLNVKVKDAVSVLNYVVHINRNGKTAKQVYDELIVLYSECSEAGRDFIIETCAGLLAFSTEKMAIISIDVVNHNSNTELSAFLIVQDQVVLKSRAEALAQSLPTLATPTGPRLRMPN